MPPVTKLTNTQFQEHLDEGVLEVGDYCDQMFYLPHDDNGHLYTVVMIEPELIIEAQPQTNDIGWLGYQWIGPRGDGAGNPQEWSWTSNLSDHWKLISHSEFERLKVVSNTI
jgi:hypothetical protein